ncbi:WD repeat protein [Aspergillus luchuensis]|uniref:WD repeat protein n=1 Tax=Aspergillus kawachii TaxID=1069201 RepID=A0A146G1D4_ASPKA|nr:WD repeat protein [Aspergillus luchuensis]
MATLKGAQILHIVPIGYYVFSSWADTIKAANILVSFGPDRGENAKPELSSRQCNSPVLAIGPAPSLVYVELLMLLQH